MMYPAARHRSFSLHMLVCLTLCLCLDLHAFIKAVLDVVKAVGGVGGMASPACGYCVVFFGKTHYSQCLLPPRYMYIHVNGYQQT